jgi:transcriptional regulator with XRE-family HTH domain
MGMSTDVSVGTRLRQARCRQRLTLREVAAKAGITTSALSQLERDQLNPTLGTLKALATALDITIGSLFAPSRIPDRVVVRPSERKRLSPRQGITYDLLTPDLAGQIEFILSVYDVGASTGEEFFAYPAEQCGLVLDGVAEVHLGDRVHRLDAGDSIRFDCAVPHRIVNAGPTELRCIWAIIPPTF